MSLPSAIGDRGEEFGFWIWDSGFWIGGAELRGPSIGVGATLRVDCRLCRVRNLGGRGCKSKVKRQNGRGHEAARDTGEGKQDIVGTGDPEFVAGEDTSGLA
jgi:hypothetical protein